MSNASLHGAKRQPPALVVKQAIQWMLRLNNQAPAPCVYEQCARWRAEHDDHECAWQRVQALNTELNSRFQALPAAGAAFEALETSAQRLGRRQALKLLCGTMLVGSSTWLAKDFAPWQQWSADFATRVGESGSYQLQDGTRLQLNTDSAVDQDYTPQRRLINLTKGEILVACGADAQSAIPRPLLLSSRHGLFEGIAGRFVVRQETDRTLVSVLGGQLAEGSVLIRSPATGHDLKIQPGQTFSITAQRATLLTSQAMDPGAWADGLIVTKDMRLGEFITEVARYRHGYLTCTDDIADLRLSGVFRLEDTDKLLAILPQTLPVQVRYRSRWWVTLQRQA